MFWTFRNGQVVVIYWQVFTLDNKRMNIFNHFSIIPFFLLGSLASVLKLNADQGQRWPISFPPTESSFLDKTSIFSYPFPFSWLFVFVVSELIFYFHFRQYFRIINSICGDKKLSLISSSYFNPLYLLFLLLFSLEFCDNLPKFLFCDFWSNVINPFVMPHNKLRPWVSAIIPLWFSTHQQVIQILAT